MYCIVYNTNNTWRYAGTDPERRVTCVQRGREITRIDTGGCVRRRSWRHVDDDRDRSGDRGSGFTDPVRDSAGRGQA